jgi:diacylglycerol kinase family enzyme
MPLAAFIVNRVRVSDPPGLWRRCRAAAAAAGWQPVFAETTVDERGAGLARAALAAGAGLVFAAGGDGTVRACAEALAGTGVPLAILPHGTANLTARALGVPLADGAALATGFGGRDRRVDLAFADGIAFVTMAGIGLDAEVVGATPVPLKDRLGWAAYALIGAARAAGRRTGFTVTLDSGPPVRRRARCVAVGNAGLLPGGFVLLPSARMDDGALDVGILAASGPLGWGRIAWRVLARSERDSGPLERFRARQANITADRKLPRQADGELLAPGRSLSVTVSPGALLVRVP